MMCLTADYINFIYGCEIKLLVCIYLSLEYVGSGFRDDMTFSKIQGFVIRVLVHIVGIYIIAKYNMERRRREILYYTETSCCGREPLRMFQKINI